MHDYPLPKPIKKGLRVKMFDIVTGKTHETETGYTVWWWGMGNGACDCNRCLELPEIEKQLQAENGEDSCFGNKRFLIIDIINNGCEKIADKNDAIKFMNQGYPGELLAKYLPEDRR